MLRDLLDVLAPPACLVCRAPPPRGEHICWACRAALPWIEDPCPRCALPRADAARRGGAPVSACAGGAACPAGRAAFAASYAPVAHAGTARDLLLALKLRGAQPAADVMAAQIAARAPRAVLEGATLVPVPGRADRRQRQGLDPAHCLARALGRRTGAPVADCLVRVDAGGRQVGRGRQKRRRGRRFERSGPAPEGPIVLVDDVHTTGATLDACARTLASAGNLHITAVTYVRTLTGA